MNKKHQVIKDLYEICEKRDDFVFHNDLIKKICVKVGFGNPFDVTKIDDKDKLPPLLIKHDMAIIHLGSGFHQFIKGINNIYHDFEAIQHTQEWLYKKSLLNQLNSSESNILSVANNQRILHDFLFSKETELTDADIVKRSKTYFPHRTKTSFEYTINNSNIQLTNIQIEIDLTIEFDGTIGIFEAKNGKPNSFSVYQLYHPFLYYHNAKQNSVTDGKIKNIYGVYIVREKTRNNDTLKLWCYTFAKPYEMTSIKFIKSRAYQLIPS